MAKEHFDEEGFPVFSKIVRPIVDFVNALTIESGEDERINIINPLDIPHTDRYVTKYIRPIDSNINIGSKPIKVNGIYVVGS